MNPLPPDAQLKLEAISCSRTAWRIQSEGKWDHLPHGWALAFKLTHETTIVLLVWLWLMFYAWWLLIEICVLIFQMYAGFGGQWSTKGETLLISLGNLGNSDSSDDMTCPSPNPLSHDALSLLPQREHRQMRARPGTEAAYLKIFK